MGVISEGDIVSITCRDNGGSKASGWHAWPPTWPERSIATMPGLTGVRPKLSILMCAFNEQQRIAQAINEILTTWYPCEIELIVVDDGSTDDTATVVEKVHDPR